MRNSLAFLAALGLTFFGVGYFLNWYSISTTPGPDGRRSVTIDLNTKKIGEDIHTGTEKIQTIIENAGKDKNETKTTTPGDGKTPATPTSKTGEQSGWWTPAPILPPAEQKSAWDTRQPTSSLPPGPWRSSGAYQEVPLVIPSARDR